jgi:hypothetical protein
MGQNTQGGVSAPTYVSGRTMPSQTNRYFSGLSRNTFLLAFTSLFADISTEMLVPILPVFLTQTLKASGSVVGLVEGIAGATQNMTQGLSGSLSDKLQRRKPIALAGYLLAAMGKPLMGSATIWQGVLGGQVRQVALARTSLSK